MGAFDKLITAAKAGISAAYPAFGVVDAAKGFITEAVAQRIRDEAIAKASALLAQAHRDVITAIAWQNSLLLVSLLPVYLLHSPYPFYAAYAVVLAYNGYSCVKAWPFISRWLHTRSLTQMLGQEVLAAIEAELQVREFHERKAVEWLGPDLKELSFEVARKLRADVIAAGVNMAFTLLLAFVAFRIFAIPLLEQQALLG